MADSEKNEDDKLDSTTVICVCLIYLLATLFTIAGNLIAIIVIWRTKEFREVTRILMANLAVTDLLVGVLILPCIIHTAATKSWIFGNIWCQFTGFNNLLLCSVSAMSLTAVSYERYIAIVYSLRYIDLLTLKRSVIVVAVIWLSAAVGASVPFFGIGKYKYFDNRLTCGLDYKDNLVFTVTVIVFYFVLPVSWMFYIYYHIFKTARRHARSVHALIISLPGHNIGFSSKERKATSTIVIIIGVYLLTWTPATIVQIISLSASTISIPPEVDTVTTCLLFLNSACNPWIYCGMNAVFRQGLRRQTRLLLQCIGWKCINTSQDAEQNNSTQSTVNMHNQDSNSVV
ncbi:G-protein coupled receptor 161-like [Saccoglossus kowalevskii]|uniref:G-protein coupled receptor 161-like n=1 Tax=Saccoglossus kowalevskii TaxID=10224 RepID=A0ABM0M684_SACKO|nr:PREDICTED: G-protein coupled receptor 161-like [Saccoglossus kowalevskii]